MLKIINPWLHKEGYNCFGCAPENPIGLHMHFYEEGDKIVSFWQPQSHFQGWVGTLHGGIISTLIDETAGWAVSRKLQTAGMTSRLNVSFRKPIASDDPQLIIKAWITARKRNFVEIHVTVENNQQEICAEADVTYYAMGEEKASEMGFLHCDVEEEQLFPF